jgi:hypothetical protein
VAFHTVAHPDSQGKPIPFIGENRMTLFKGSLYLFTAFTFSAFSLICSFCPAEWSKGIGGNFAARMVRGAQSG